MTLPSSFLTLVFLTCLPMPVFAAEPPTTEPDVLMSFEKPCSSRVLREMKQEVESLMKHSCRGLDWQLAENVLGHDFSEPLVVVKFKGKCSSEDFGALRTTSQALARTYVSNGRVLPFIQVDCNRVRSLVRPAIAFEGFIRKEALLGRALGRVLAHELYHVFANTVRHGKEGLAKQNVTPKNLTEYGFEFEESDWLLMTEELHSPARSQSAAAALDTPTYTEHTEP